MFQMIVVHDPIVILEFLSEISLPTNMSIHPTTEDLVVFEDEENSKLSSSQVYDQLVKGSDGRTEVLPLQNSNSLNINVSLVLEKRDCESIDQISLCSKKDPEILSSIQGVHDTIVEIASGPNNTTINSTISQNHQEPSHIDRASDADLQSQSVEVQLPNSNSLTMNLSENNNHAITEAMEVDVDDCSHSTRNLNVDCTTQSTKSPHYRRSLRKTSRITYTIVNDENDSDFGGSDQNMKGSAFVKEKVHFV
jgi:hypothetical protein